MPAAKITSKGQVTIPQDVRRALGVGEGDRIEFVPMEGGGFAIKPATKSIMALKGIIPLRRKPATLKEMQEAIIAGATRGSMPRAKRKKS